MTAAMAKQSINLQAKKAPKISNQPLTPAERKQFNVDERVDKMMKKHRMSREDAEEIVREVIETKERPAKLKTYPVNRPDGKTVRVTILDNEPREIHDHPTENEIKWAAERTAEQAELVPLVKPGTVTRVDRLRPGQHFVCEMLPHFSHRGHLVYANPCRARVSLEREATTREFTNKRTGEQVSLTASSPKMADWAPETEVVALAQCEDAKDLVQNNQTKAVAKTAKKEYNQSSAANGKAQREGTTMAEKTIKVGVGKGTNGAAPAKSATTAAKPMKKAAAAPEGVLGRRKVVLSVQKMPKEGEAPAQAIAVLAILKEIGKASPDELIAKMRGKIESKQDMRAVLNLYRAKLAAGGFLKIANATA